MLSQSQPLQTKKRINEAGIGCFQRTIRTQFDPFKVREVVLGFLSKTFRFKGLDLAKKGYGLSVLSFLFGLVVSKLHRSS